MKRLLFVAFVALALLSVAPAAQADPGGGAFHAECTRFPGPFPGATGGEIVLTPGGSINANCRYPGPAEGGGAEHAYGTCVITPAGNFQCHTPQGGF